MRIYLAGPMRNIPFFNFSNFDAVAYMLRGAGHTVLNPADKDREVYGKDFELKFPTGQFSDCPEAKFSLREALEYDLSWICRKADTLYMLTGWEHSGGARAEHAVAAALNLKIIYEEDYENNDCT